MAKPDNSTDTGGLKKDVADKPTPTYNSPVGKTWLRSLYDAHLKYKGLVTGKPYEWPRAGTMVAVSDSDVPDLLGKRLGAGNCCGAGASGQIFEVVEL